MIQYSMRLPNAAEFLKDLVVILEPLNKVDCRWNLLRSFWILIFAESRGTNCCDFFLLHHEFQVALFSPATLFSGAPLP